MTANRTRSMSEAFESPAAMCRMAQHSEILITIPAMNANLRVRLSQQLRRAGKRTGDRVSVMRAHGENLLIRRSLR